MLCTVTLQIMLNWIGNYFSKLSSYRKIWKYNLLTLLQLKIIKICICKTLIAKNSKNIFKGSGWVFVKETDYSKTNLKMFSMPQGAAPCSCHCVEACFLEVLWYIIFIIWTSTFCIGAVQIHITFSHCFVMIYIFSRRTKITIQELRVTDKKTMLKCK